MVAVRRQSFKDLEEFHELAQDPYAFLDRLTIVKKPGHKRVMLGEAGRHEEQNLVIEALLTYQLVLILKARQLGISTIVLAFLFWLALTSGDDYEVTTVCHEVRACGRMNKVIKTFVLGLPKVLRPKVLTWSMHTVELQVGRSRITFRQVMAGGKDQGRSQSTRALHFTEAGFYPTGSAAMKGSEVDEDSVASYRSLLPEPIEDDPLARDIMESTAFRPTGVLYKNVRIAVSNPEIGFVFLPWFKFKKYRRHIADPREFEKTLTDEEKKLLAQHGREGMTLEHIAFRRWKILVQGIGPSRFRKEYPSTWMDPFIVGSGMWFDVERLNDMLALLANRPVQKAGYREYLPPEGHRRFYIGVDTAGGVGTDEAGDSDGDEPDQAVINVTRDDLETAAVFSTREMGPSELADRCARIYVKYGRPPILCEKNKYGHRFIQRCRELNLAVWTDKNGKDWWTDPKTKLMLLDWSRVLIDNGHARLNDPVEIAEHLTIREQDDGDVRADAGYKDDHVIAKALALWNARRAYLIERPAMMTMAQRLERHRSLEPGRRT